MLEAMLLELKLRRNEMGDHKVRSVYFGGGTPSLLSIDDLQLFLNAVDEYFDLVPSPEITIEANPDDLTRTYLKDLSKTAVNRLSIGIQSFHDNELKMMNRAHDAVMARAALDQATDLFENLSIDLIYGIPGSNRELWLQNIETALSYEVPHISSYALTVEPKTALAAFIKKGLIPEVDEDLAEEQFFMLIDRLESSGFVHYELSNFGKKGYFSVNNSAYWQGKPYLGVGPSSHSYDGRCRSWNVRNNSIYIRSIHKGELPVEREELSKTDRYNEMVMTGLRTMWGISLQLVEIEFGNAYKNYLLKQAEEKIQQQLLYIDGDYLHVTKKGKFLCDGIASSLFKLNLK